MGKQCCTGTIKSISKKVGLSTVIFFTDEPRSNNFEYLRKIEAMFENTLKCQLGAQIVTSAKKNKG